MALGVTPVHREQMGAARVLNIVPSLRVSDDCWTHGVSRVSRENCRTFPASRETWNPRVSKAGQVNA